MRAALAALTFATGAAVTTPAMAQDANPNDFGKKVMEEGKFFMEDNIKYTHDQYGSFRGEYR
jgi:hypothetical protein